jgi:hypothetical protein
MDIDALPQPPKVNDLAEFDAEQSRLASTHPVLHGGDIFLQRAYAVIAELSPLSDLNEHQCADLADALATVGSFDEAAKYSPDKAEEFHQIVNALSTKDPCLCPYIKTVQMIDGKAKEIDVPQTFTFNKVYSNGEWIPLLKCNNCGHLST